MAGYKGYYTTTSKPVAKRADSSLLFGDDEDEYDQQSLRYDQQSLRHSQDGYHRPSEHTKRPYEAMDGNGPCNSNKVTKLDNTAPFSSKSYYSNNSSSGSNYHENRSWGGQTMKGKNHLGNNFDEEIVSNHDPKMDFPDGNLNNSSSADRKFSGESFDYRNSSGQISDGRKNLFGNSSYQQRVQTNSYNNVDNEYSDFPLPRGPTQYVHEQYKSVVKSEQINVVSKSVNGYRTGKCLKNERTISHGNNFVPLTESDRKPCEDANIVNPCLSNSSYNFSQNGLVLPPELAMPVFQTVDRSGNNWAGMVGNTPTAPVACRQQVTPGNSSPHQTEEEEKWAWSNGKKWVGVSEARPKLNFYTRGPTIRDFDSANRVQGGIGEKLLQRMGWNPGEGLGKEKEGDVEPIRFSEIKLDRKGLVSEVEDKVKAEDEMEAVVRGKTKFSEIKSTSFWNWHGTGMKGPERMQDRLKKEKQVQKAKVPLNLAGKHPISALMELSQRKRWPEPRFTPQHVDGKFLFTVALNGTSYTPEEGSDTKKSGKADSAKHALISLGLWPKDSV